MVVIFSKSGDVSTNHVIDWLDYYSIAHARINRDEFIQFYSNFHTIEEAHENINSIWIRRNTNDNPIHSCLPNNSQHESSETIDFFLAQELATLKEYFILHCNKFVLGNYNKVSLNKLLVLEAAKKVGLNIPNTSIVHSKPQLEKLTESKNKLITKPLFEPLGIHHKAYGKLNSYTEKIDQSDIIPDSFFPSLIQEQIEKDYEIRVFYIDGKFYSMAIFSQLSKQTSVDFRRYNTAKGNRNVPYQLDDSTEKKITQLMKMVDLNTGSIDLIMAKDEKIYFLEINPVGQYGMVSTPCNYHLDEVIAKRLM